MRHVILVHRMLKNAVPIPEYLLLTEAVFGRIDDCIRNRGRALEQELEGLGVVPTYFKESSVPARPEKVARRRLRHTWPQLGMMLGRLRCALGLVHRSIGVVRGGIDRV